MTWKIVNADVIEGLRTLEAESVQTVVTSPPYWGLRDYGTASWEGGDPGCDHVAGPAVSSASTLGGGKQPDVVMPFMGDCGKCGAIRADAQIGLEPTPEAYVDRMVEVFREVRRVLRPDGTVWLNLGDSYSGDKSGGRNDTDKMYPGDPEGLRARRKIATTSGLKPKDLVGIPWRVAFALQADGWWLRSDIIWAKPNPMPESITDRPTRSHEYVFLLTKSARYFYDAEAVREDAKDWSTRGPGVGITETFHYGADNGGNGGLSDLAQRYKDGEVEARRNMRSVWNIATHPFSEAHFATFPQALVAPCVKAGSSEKGCCQTCGAPYRRVLERTAGKDWNAHKDPGDRLRLGRGTGAHADADRINNPPRTIGWERSCVHEGDPVPCVVMDIFAGSGTAGVVALRHGRSFVGIELNPAYAEMARKSLETDRSRDGTLSILNMGGEV